MLKKGFCRPWRLPPRWFSCSALFSIPALLPVSCAFGPLHLAAVYHSKKRRAEITARYLPAPTFVVQFAFVWRGGIVAQRRLKKVFGGDVKRLKKFCLRGIRRHHL